MQNRVDPKTRHWSRRAWLRLAGLGSLTGGVALASQGSAAGESDPVSASASVHLGDTMGPVGLVSTEFFDPTRFLRTWNFSDLPADERAQVYRETPKSDGTTLREYELFAVDREIEIAPGVFFPAWTYNGQVPGPTIRATVGDHVRITFVNQGSHPHGLHFHGWHPPEMDGSLPAHQVMPGESFLYEFDAEPFGVHLYHCHANPLKRHVHKGLYGAFIVDPPSDVSRPPADELVMVLNGFDTNFDADNEVYAANTVASFYMQEPIRVQVGQLVRIYVVNLTEFDLIKQLAPAWNVLRRLSHRDVADLIRVDRHHHAVSGRAGDSRDHVSLSRRLHVPRPSGRVRRTGMDGAVQGRGGA